MECSGVIYDTINCAINRTTTDCTSLKLVFSNSSLQTQKLAKKFLEKLKGKNLICLYGQLGSGKTTFVQGLAKALGVKKRVVSPTFILLREYEVTSHQSPVARKENSWELETGGWQRLTHLDCYRIESEQDLKSFDLKELWEDKKNLVVIEWAEKLKKILPKERIDIKFEYVGRNKRRILISC